MRKSDPSPTHYLEWMTIHSPLSLISANHQYFRGNWKKILRKKNDSACACAVAEMGAERTLWWRKCGYRNGSMHHLNSRFEFSDLFLKPNLPVNRQNSHIGQSYLSNMTRNFGYINAFFGTGSCSESSWISEFLNFWSIFFLSVFRHGVVLDCANSAQRASSLHRTHLFLMPLS